MPFDGSGNFDRVHDWTADEAAAIKVRADRFDQENDDFATAFENCITRDGQGKPTANIDFNNKKITNLADPTTLKGALNVQTAQENDYSFGTATGSANTYAVTLGIVSSAYVDGMPFRVEINVTNTGSSTLNVDTHGAKTIKIDGQDLTGGELIANSIYWFAYNSGTGFIDLIKPANATESLKGIVELATNAETVTGTSTSLATHPSGVNAAISNALGLFGGIGGLRTENDTDTDHDIKTNVGICIDATKSVLINLASALTKRIDASWAEGDGNGGFPTGISLTPNSPLHYFLISKTDGTVDGGWDSSLTATNLLADATAYTYYRRIWGHWIDGSSNIYNYVQYGNYNILTSPILEYSGAGHTSAFLHTISTPLGIKIMAILNTIGTDAGVITYFSSPDTTDVVPSAANAIFNAVGNAGVGTGNTDNIGTQLIVLTNTSSQVRERSSTTNTFSFSLNGWIDNREL
jgi:hypothetical protein